MIMMVMVMKMTTLMRRRRRMVKIIDNVIVGFTAPGVTDPLAMFHFEPKKTGD